LKILCSTLILLLLSGSVFSASFTHKGEVIKSSVSVKSIECGQYKIDLKKENFPFKHEMNVPQKFKIKGFHGSNSTIGKDAVLQPAGVIVPRPNDLPKLKANYPADRTYLAGSAVCKGNKVIVAYWSGGNCSECEAFVSFEVLGSKLLNPTKVSYQQYKAISQ
jgi:hypothetical protein